MTCCRCGHQSDVSFDSILVPTIETGLDPLRPPNPELIANLNIEAVLDKLSPHYSDGVRPIADFLRATLSAKTVQINCLRAALVTPPQNDRPWPVILWKEGDDTEMVLIIKVEPTASVYSSIIHRTIDTGHSKSPRWRCELSWSLWVADDLTDLLSVATHVFHLVTEGHPELTKTNSSENEDVSGEDPLEYATKLFPIFYRVREFEMQCKVRGRRWVEDTSEQEEVEDNLGNKLIVLRKVQNLV
jgi:hypothetical protein